MRTVLDSSTAFIALGVSLLGWLLVSSFVIVGRARYDLGARDQRHGVGPIRGSRAERRLLRRAASRPRTDLGKWRRIGALRELARVRHPACSTLLPAALADRDDDVVGAAVRSLGELESDWAAGLLLGALDDGAHPRSRVAAQLEHFVPWLREELETLLDDDEAPVRYWAATLLARYDDASVDRLVEAAGDRDANVRAAAIGALAALGARSARPRIVAALRDEAWVVRLHSCRALGMLGGKSEAAKIAPLLRDAQWWVRTAAKDALRELAPKSLDALCRALDDDDEFARNGAAEVLQDVGVVDGLMESGADPILLERILAAGGRRLRATAVARDAQRDDGAAVEAA